MRRSLLRFMACAIFVLTCLVSGCNNNNVPIANVALVLTPLAANVTLGSSLQFTVTTSGSIDTGIFWGVNGYLGGDAGYPPCKCGTITQNGLYTPPAVVPVPNTVSVDAVSHANSNDVVTATVTLVSNVAISVSPTSVNLVLGQNQPQQFNATVTGNSNTGVTWQVAGGSSGFGKISSTGLYSPPASVSVALPATVGVTATSVVDTTKSATANVVLHSPINVAVSPPAASIQTFGSQQFTATVTDAPSTGITWEVNGIAGGGPTIGTITQTGFYTAPNSVPTQASNGASIIAPVTVQAVSQADSYFTGSAVVTVVAPNKSAQTIPTPLGVSGGNKNDVGSGQCSGGTLGSLVSLNGNQYILGTSSVLARNDLGVIGDPIIQPSLTDASTPCSSTGTPPPVAVANLSQFYNLETGTGTPVDAAIAEVVSGEVDPLGNILLLGATTSNGQSTNGAPHAGSGVAPTLNLAVAKSGRSTGLTCSTIEGTNITAKIQYQKGYGATATNFLVTYSDLVQIAGVEGANFSATGDSGSLIVTQNTSDPVALVIASIDTGVTGSSPITFGSPVSDVLAAMGNPVFVGSSSPHAVAGCSLPAPQPAVATKQATMSSETLLQATAVRNIHATELLSNAAVQAVGVSSSLDDPSAAAIVLFVTNDATPSSLPAQIEGVRTKIVKIGANTNQGVLSLDESATLESSATTPSTPIALPDSEVARARSVHSAHADELMKLQGVQGVGISSSADNPAEAALMIYLIRGVAHAEIPAVIDGVRTRIKESSRFIANP